MKKEIEYSTDNGFIKWMIGQGGVVFLWLPRGLGWLAESLRRILMFGLDGVIEALFTLVIFYIIFLAVKWKENQIKTNAPAANNKIKWLLLAIVLGLIFLTSK